LHTISFTTTTNSATIVATVDNNSSTTRSAIVEVKMTPPGATIGTMGEPVVCSKDANNIAAYSSKSISCSFTGLSASENYYLATASLVGNAAEQDNATVSTSFKIGTNSAATTGDCWIDKSTQFYDSKSALEWYVEATPGIQWTQDIPDLLSLRNIIQGDSFLMYDAYTEDFKKDFVEYYTKTAFYNTPSYFHQHPQKQNLKQYFEKNNMKFRVKFTDSERLPSAGLYKIDLNISFGNEWKLFDVNGMPTAKIGVLFYRLNDPVPDSALYYVPFDGEVGKSGTSLSRQGYGTQYVLPTDETFKLNESEQLHALPDAGSNALVRLTVEKRDSLKMLNGLSSKRGFLFSIEQGASQDDKTLIWAPSNATPIIARVKHNASAEPFSVFYSARNNNTPEIVGNTLTFWSGAGVCYDFSGQLVNEAFDFKPDRKARQNDSFLNWAGAYGLDWSGSDLPDNSSVFLKTTIFTPIGKNYSLFAEKGDVFFQSPDDAESNAVRLQGISTMPFNRSGANELDRVNSIEDLFGLVEGTSACVTNSGVRTSIWWNPETLFKQAVGDKSIQSIENSLNPTKACVTSVVH
jgi:hypothetical protein